MHPINMVAACLGLNKRQRSAIQINVLTDNLTGAVINLREQLTVVAVEVNRRLTVDGLLDPLPESIVRCEVDERRERKPVAQEAALRVWVIPPPVYSAGEKG